MTGARHVGVNLLWLVPGEVGGSESYLVRLLEGVAERSTPGLRLTLFALPAFAAAHPDLAAAFPVATAPVSGRSRPRRVAAESTWLPVAARRARVDLLHHGGGTVPVTPAAPAVLTVHDLQYLTYPQTFSRAKLAYLRRTVPASVRRARMVCTPSEWVRGTVVDGLGVPAERVAVVPHGLGDADRSRRATGEAELRRRYRLDGPFVVFPAITYRHKDHATLLRALAEVPGLSAVLTGGVGPVEAEVTALARDLGLAERVRRPGRVPVEDLDGLYLSAVACAFPSRYEGFGAPVLEAMAAGCPVVAADATALPEVVGDAGLLVPPGDVAAWAEALRRVRDDDDLRARLAVAGRARAAGATADRAAAALESAWACAAGSSGAVTVPAGGR